MLLSLETAALACWLYVAIVNLVQWVLLIESVREVRNESRTHRRSGPSPEPICVIVPCYNEAAHLPLLLEHLTLQTIASDLQVIVADDGSTDGTADIADAMGRELAERLNVVVLRLGRRGKGAAIDKALAHVDVPLVALLDADIQLLPPALEVLRRALTPDVDAVSPLVIVDPDNPQSGLLSRVLVRMQMIEYLRAVVWRPGWQRLGAVGVVEGRLGLFRAAALSAVGPFARLHIAVDYEISAALVRRARGRRRCLRLVVEEPILTAVPLSWEGLAAQRWRWFLGLGKAHRRNSILSMLRSGARSRAAEYLLRDFVHPWPFVELCWWALVVTMAVRGRWTDVAIAAGSWSLHVLSAASQLVIASHLGRRLWPKVRHTPSMGAIAMFAVAWQPLRAAAVTTGALLHPGIGHRLWFTERTRRTTLNSSATHRGAGGS